MSDSGPFCFSVCVCHVWLVPNPQIKFRALINKRTEDTIVTDNPHPWFEYKQEEGKLRVTQILLLEFWSVMYFLPVLRILLWFLWPSKDSREWPCTLPLASGTWASWRPVLPVRTELKEFSTLDVSVSFVTRSSSAVGLTFPQSSFCCWCTCWSPSSHLSYSSPGFGLRNPIPAQLGTISVFFLVPEQARLCSPAAKGYDPVFLPCSLPLEILSSTISWTLQPWQPPTFTSLTRSSCFESRRFIRVSPVTSSSITYVRKLPSVHPKKFSLES